MFKGDEGRTRVTRGYSMNLQLISSVFMKIQKTLNTFTLKEPSRPQNFIQKSKYYWVEGLREKRKRRSALVCTCLATGKFCRGSLYASLSLLPLPMKASAYRFSTKMLLSPSLINSKASLML